MNQKTQLVIKLLFKLLDDNTQPNEREVIKKELSVLVEQSIANHQSTHCKEDTIEHSLQGQVIDDKLCIMQLVMQLFPLVFTKKIVSLFLRDYELSNCGNALLITSFQIAITSKSKKPYQDIMALINSEKVLFGIKDTLLVKIMRNAIATKRMDEFFALDEESISNTEKVFFDCNGKITQSFETMEKEALSKLIDKLYRFSDNDKKKTALMEFLKKLSTAAANIPDKFQIILDTLRTFFNDEIYYEKEKTFLSQLFKQVVLIEKYNDAFHVLNKYFWKDEADLVKVLTIFFWEGVKLDLTKDALLRVAFNKGATKNDMGFTFKQQTKDAWYKLSICEKIIDQLENAKNVSAIHKYMRRIIKQDENLLVMRFNIQAKQISINPNHHNVPKFLSLIKIYFAEKYQANSGKFEQDNNYQILDELVHHIIGQSSDCFFSDSREQEEWRQGEYEVLKDNKITKKKYDLMDQFFAKETKGMCDNVSDEEHIDVKITEDKLQKDKLKVAFRYWFFKEIYSDNSAIDIKNTQVTIVPK